MESIPEKNLEDKLYSYLEENQGKAFTIGALLERLEEIVLDPEVRKHGKKKNQIILVRKYGRKNIQIIYSNYIQIILEKLKDNDRIKSIPHQNLIYYWYPDPEYPLRTPVDFVTLKKRKTGHLDSASKSSWKNMTLSGRVAAVTAIIGFIFIIAGGIIMSIPGSSTGNDQLSPSVPASLTFIIVGVIVLFISLMIATHRSKCWECCGAC